MIHDLNSSQELKIGPYKIGKNSWASLYIEPSEVLALYALSITPHRLVFAQGNFLGTQHGRVFLQSMEDPQLDLMSGDSVDDIFKNFRIALFHVDPSAGEPCGSILCYEPKTRALYWFAPQIMGVNPKPTACIWAPYGTDTLAAMSMLSNGATHAYGRDGSHNVSWCENGENMFSVQQVNPKDMLFFTDGGTLDLDERQLLTILELSRCDLNIPNWHKIHLAAGIVAKTRIITAGLYNWHMPASTALVLVQE